MNETEVIAKQVVNEEVPDFKTVISALYELQPFEVTFEKIFELQRSNPTGFGFERIG